ncbi:unnamed protein product [Diamesa serratosioi]
MKFKSSFLVSNISLILFLTYEVKCQRTVLDAAQYRPLFRSVKEMIYNFISSRSSDGALEFNLRAGKLQKQFQQNEPFFCDVNGAGARSLSVPTSVHKLRPGDIDVIGALGDSLTAGNGALAVDALQFLLEYKGVSWSIGGQGDFRKFLTLPNILKEYNPNLYGYSLNTGYTFQKVSAFNVAEFGAMSRDIPFESKVLIQRMRADPKVDMKSHWKLITLLIGSNDFCSDMCYRKIPEKIIELHELDLLATFRNIRDNLPRTMLNVVLNPSLKVLVEFTGKPNVCVITNNFECPCMFAAKYLHNRQVYYKLMEEWKQIAFDVANQEEFQNLQDFTINVQPFLTKVEFPKTRYNITDYRYLSTDCFHISQIGHARISNALWNNMLEPVGQKAFNWKKEFQELKCPTHQRPYLATRFNS